MPSIHAWYGYLSRSQLKEDIIMDLEFALVRYTEHRCGEVVKRKRCISPPERICNRRKKS
jgi:hypothetical protein